MKINFKKKKKTPKNSTGLYPPLNPSTVTTSRINNICPSAVVWPVTTPTPYQNTHCHYKSISSMILWKQWNQMLFFSLVFEAYYCGRRITEEITSVWIKRETSKISLPLLSRTLTNYYNVKILYYTTVVLHCYRTFQM